MNSSLKFFNENSLISLLAKGGWVMIPIAILSISAVYFIIERVFALRNSQVYLRSEKLESINKKLVEGDYDMVYSMCNTKKLPMTIIIKAGLDKFISPDQNFESAIEIAARGEVIILEKNVDTLSKIPGMATMLGFFGTVIGMIEAFMAISLENGPVGPNIISTGIYEALITTAAGLFIAIFTTIGYNFISSRINKITLGIEKSSNELIELFKNLQKINNSKSFTK